MIMKNYSHISYPNWGKDRFRLVCKVRYHIPTGKWIYSNVNKTLMFSQHRGWVYLIVVNNIINKIGETGNPLGIHNSRKNALNTCVENNKSRLGRLIYGDGTDKYIREALKNEKNIKIYAKKCPPGKTSSIFDGKREKLNPTPHKILETKYLKLFKEKTGRLPKLNKSLK